MIPQQANEKVKVNVSSECGRLNAVLLHRPGVEIERMTPENAAEALYSDILNKHIVDQEYNRFCGIFEKWCKVFYVSDLLRELLENNDIRQYLITESCEIDDCEFLAGELNVLDNDTLAKALIEGYEYRPGSHPKRYADARYVLKPLYNLFFTRDASSSVYNRVLINSMSFQVRRRETLIYRTIFKYYFNTELLCAQDWRLNAHTEGGDVQIASDNVLCIGNGIRTNRKGIDYLARTFAQEREDSGKPFYIVAQELPFKPESFIHLDMVFTFLSTHQCMAYEPMLAKTGAFSSLDTTLITIEGGKIHYDDKKNILEALRCTGMDLEPVLCGGADPWDQQREQWHSGANFFALDEGRVVGYERNVHTIEALDRAGFAVLSADDICAGKVDMNDYEKFVATFKAGELPRGGGGARCMTMPINRDAVKGI